jgi:hypothetical protein
VRLTAKRNAAAKNGANCTDGAGSNISWESINGSKEGTLVASAAKLALFQGLDRDGRCWTPTVAEEYDLLTGEDIFAASAETSRIYNAQVLAKAIVIVQTRLRISSLSRMARMLGRGTTIVYRWAEGTHPIGATAMEHALRDLIFLLDEKEKR